MFVVLFTRLTFVTGFVYMFLITFMGMLWKSNNKSSLINIPNVIVNLAVQLLFVVIRFVTIVETSTSSAFQYLEDT